MTTLDEAKGTVDKTSGHGKKDPASPFSVGQRVAQYKGMGKTIHGNVVTPHTVSGGTKGAMVKFSHGTEFVPHKDLKDASQYWKDEQDAMYKKRSVKEETELSEMKALPRRHFFDSHGLEKHGIAYTDNKNWWKVVDGKPVAHTADHEVVKSWKRELNAMTKQVKEEVELEEGSSGTIIHKVNHEGKVKFITRYAKAAEAVAKKIEANTGKACKITQHISDKNGFYRLHKEAVELDMHEEEDWEAEEREEKRKKMAAAMSAVNHLSKSMDRPTGSNYPAWLKRKQDAAKKLRDTKTVSEATLSEESIPVQHVTDAVHKVLGAQATVRFLTHLKPGADIHTSWNKVNSALTKQGIKPRHIANIATHLRPANYK